jgi:5-methylcytosine-specific restriction endonuclease McrA
MPLAIDGIKVCTKCKCAKPTAEFHKDKSNKDGLMSICIKCKREYRISPFYKSRERELEKTPEYRLRKKRYYKTDKGRFEKSREHHVCRSRSGRQKQEHDLTFIQWACILINQRHGCAVCSNTFDDNNQPVLDCIIPLSRGGVLTFSNTQALCNTCNSKKQTRMYSGLGNRWRHKYTL